MSSLRLACGIAAGALGAALPAAHMTDTMLISLHVAVEDADGRPVTGIEPEEFTLLLDNAPVPIVEVSAPRPIELIVIVDITAHAPRNERSLRDGIERVGAALREGDRAHVWRVGGRITRGPEFTKEARSRRTAAGFAVNPANVERSGPSPIWDAIVEAAGALEQAEGRRAILLYTDGRASGNHHAAADAAARALAADVSVTVVMPRGELSFRNDDRLVTVHPDRMPQAIARDSGGAFTYFPPRNWNRDNGRPPTFGETLAAVVTSLHREYVLRVAQPDGGPRLVEVRVSRPGLVLRARRAI